VSAPRRSSLTIVEVDAEALRVPEPVRETPAQVAERLGAEPPASGSVLFPNWPQGYLALAEMLSRVGPIGCVSDRKGQLYIGFHYHGFTRATELIAEYVPDEYRVLAEYILELAVLDYLPDLSFLKCAVDEQTTLNRVCAAIDEFQVELISMGAPAVHELLARRFGVSWGDVERLIKARRLIHRQANRRQRRAQKARRR